MSSKVFQPNFVQRMRNFLPFYPTFQSVKRAPLSEGICPSRALLWPRAVGCPWRHASIELTVFVGLRNFARLHLFPSSSGNATGFFRWIKFPLGQQLIMT
ncbi:hypothetical protein niasHT_003849 [Heterodera trifolii]|uniref:Uncharacterized protein n=1 Tax=Heterodera trifolii TaxID=157864 RepID=A0ABD2LVA9_9BILA